MVRKVLCALIPEWEKKTTAIEEANDLTQLSPENLVGNLIAYEVQLEERKKDLESQQSKKKTLAFKAMSDSEDEEEDEEEIAMFTRKFKKFLRKCHIKKDCPLQNGKYKEKASNFKKDKYTKNKFMKNKKAYQATWDYSDSSSEEENEKTNELLSGATFLGAVFCFSAFCFKSLYAYITFFSVGELLVFATQGPVSFICLHSVKPSQRPLSMAISTVSIHIFGDVPSSPLVGILQDHINNWRASALILTSVLFISAALWSIGIFLPSVDQFNEECEHGISNARSNRTPLLGSIVERPQETA